nr:hypothetical protein [Kibdelosporangium sp. MJ126-NF4]
MVCPPGWLCSRDFLCLEKEGVVGSLPYDLPEETTACREVGIACAAGRFA